MAYRNGTYIAFYAEGKTEPDETDMKYYNLLKAWNSNDSFQFNFVNSHEKTSALSDASKKARIEDVLKERLRNSKNMILIIGKTTKNDVDWVPLEIRYAIDVCEIPIIAAYTGYTRIDAPKLLSSLWPVALSARIENETAHVLHVPFKEKPLLAAVSQFDHNNFPNGKGLGVYDNATYRSWGLAD